MNESGKNKKNLIIGAVILAALVVIFSGAFLLFKEKVVAGSKSVEINVTNAAGDVANYSLRTDAEYLRGAMEEADGLTFSGQEGDYGMMVDTVNGERADYNLDNAYWSFYVNGDYCNYGIDQQPVEDGDSFDIIYTPN